MQAKLPHSAACIAFAGLSICHASEMHVLSWMYHWPAFSSFKVRRDGNERFYFIL
jgi:hypothetical protein